MSKENTYRSKEDLLEESKAENVKNSAKSSAKKSAPASKVKFKNPISSLSEKIDKKKTKRIIGSILVLLSFFFFFACLSYFFTWNVDQDRVLNKSLFTFLFEEETEPVTFTREDLENKLNSANISFQKNCKDDTLLKKCIENNLI
jgi:Fe2+ transport system protein B